ncbi:MAG: hypothetical protein WBD15_15740, partial [Pseudolabrys sp.]
MFPSLTVTLSCSGMLPTFIFYRNVTDAARVSSLQAQQGLHRERICDSRWLIVLQRAPRVLIVEDELFIGLLIEETVRLIGFKISAIADNISKANLELSKRNFDVVLLDLNIGGKYSTELADRVIKAKVPLVFITGYDYLIEPPHRFLFCKSHLA